MPTKIFLGKITPLVFLCVFCLGIMAVIITGQICNLCSWYLVLWTSLSYFQDLEVAFSCRKVWGSGRCGWQWGGSKTSCYHFSWGHSLTFPQGWAWFSVWGALKRPHQSQFQNLSSEAVPPLQVYLAAGTVYGLEGQLNELEDAARCIHSGTDETELADLEDQVATAAAQVHHAELQVRTPSLPKWSTFM